MVKRFRTTASKFVEAIRTKTTQTKEIIVEVVALGSVVAGIAQIYRPAAYIVAGATVIFAIERQPETSK
jgi:hypothetical protein